jgi:hypothetical protein
VRKFKKSRRLDRKRSRIRRVSRNGEIRKDVDRISLERERRDEQCGKANAEKGSGRVLSYFTEAKMAEGA